LSTRVRWRILALVFFGTTLNYLDRIALGVLVPVIRNDLHITEREYGFLTGAFQIAYTVGFLFAGKFVDVVGTRIGYLVALLWWSIAAAAHGLAGSVAALGVWRFLLGLGESGNFPAAIKCVAEWFPVRDRAFATGIFNAGTNVGATIGPPMFVAIQAYYGWRAVFLLTGALGIVWAVFWILQYRKPEDHPGVNAAERQYIRADAGPKAKALGWSSVLGVRQTWGFALGKFFTDPVFGFYLFWLPSYLYDVRQFDLRQIGWALPVVYIMADVGSVGGGWLSGFLIRRGWARGRARKTTMAICAAGMPVAALAAFAESPIMVILLVGLATAAHQGWSANLFTTTSDVFPSNAVASVTGIGGSVGGLGVFLFSTILPGFLIARVGYTPLIVGMGSFHLIAWLLVHVLMGDMEPISLEHDEALKSDTAAK
jgi:ACS family hexuronate transporter-like MFS transporter